MAFLVPSNYFLFCVHLTHAGMSTYSPWTQVVGHSYDNVELEETDEGSQENSEPVFETVYALLNHLSPSYQRTFNSAVSDKLKEQFSES